MEKFCWDCQTSKRISEFNKHRNKPDGLQNYCRTCTKRRSKDYYGKYSSPGKNKKYNLRKYGLNVDEFYNKIDGQLGLCAICCIELDEERGTHIDHSHNTKKTRGILCRSCNHLLGNAKDSIKILEYAIEYLRKWEGD